MTGRERRLLRMLCVTAGGGGGGGDKPWEEMTWDEVIAATKNGKYKSFEIGAMKELDLGTEGIVHMQIVGIDVDDLADGSGKAPLTFISKELLKTTHRMNPKLAPSSEPFDEGTGSIGGWEKCEVRKYLKETVNLLISENIRNAIKAVKKYTTIYNTTATIVNDVETSETVWVPSSREILGGVSQYQETNGPVYENVYSSSESRIKKVANNNEPQVWWLRTGRNQLSFNTITAKGTNSGSVAESLRFIALGFCL